MEVKQVIVIRKDLKMRRGKEIAQGAHASISFLTKKFQDCLGQGVDTCRLSDAEINWMIGAFTKVCLQVDSERELMEIASKARQAGLECHVITDSGKTEFNGVPTKTCLAIGPDESEAIDRVTGELELY
jgi:PTH2 family peptidyl-tRNA hydrolase